jgi:hypothetical protein
MSSSARADPPPPVFIDGIALWTPDWPSWPLAAAALRGEPAAAAMAAPALRRPAPTLLAANERRRAPDSVLLALEVAQAAVEGSGHDPRTLASVFTSAFGDLPIVDALCRTLADDPLLLSPTRFHHSVHNAASGYWAIASGSRLASTALAAFDHSFAAGLLEAATLCAADGQPVLLVAYDTEACGPLASVNTCRGLLGMALVLAPQPGPRTRWRLDWRLAAGEPGALISPAHSAAALALASNAQADGLPLFEALAHGQSARVVMAAGDGLRLHLDLLPR